MRNRAIRIAPARGVRIKGGGCRPPETPRACAPPFDRSSEGRARAAPRERAAPARDPGEPVVRARLAAITDRCWQCRTKVRGIVGVLVDPARTPDGTGFLPFDDVAEMLADRLDPRALAGRRIGRVAHRESPGVAGGYLANGCIECDALIGRFQLEDLLHEHLQAGGTYAQLDIGVPVELPAVDARAPPHGARLASTRQQMST